MDTCHVFASGYDPLEYLERWSEKHGAKSIGLIHLNDSKTPRNSHVDRHAYPGLGYIGDRVFLAVEWGHHHNIDMVLE